MTKKKIFAIVGSVRKDSVNEAILRTIAARYKENLAINIFLEIAELPHFNPDITDESVTLSVTKFRKEIAASDGVIICTPEYVFSLPGTLKNALEWTVSTTVFTDKPVALIVASGLGEKTFESLTLIMKTLGARIGKQSTLLIQGARAKYNAQRESLDTETLADIQKLMDSFIESMREP
jgi:NAD(P)H-dependent FMN reductase